jgi:hypothetical protein
MHEYTVEFRMYGESLDPESISNELGLSPSIVRHIGDKWIGKEVWDQACWGYDGAHEPDGISHWDSLEEGLNFLISKLLPHKNKIGYYNSIYELELWCGHFQSSYNGGPTFSPDLLRKLADFGVSLVIDTHFVNNDVDDEDEQNEIG